MAESRALVTGATGYIGPHLVAALVDGGWSVRATGRRVRPPRLPAAAEYLAVDLLADDLGPLLAGVTTVFHLAGASSSLSSVEGMQRVNVEGTTRLLAALPPAIDRFVHMSSTSVYGEEAPLPLPVEERSAGEPSRSYGQAKWGAELAVWAAADRGLPAVVLRPVTVYGPGAIKLLASAALDVAVERRLGRREVVLPRPTIEQRLVHLDDVVAASIHLAGSPAAVGRAFNVAGLYPTSDEVAGVLAEIHGLAVRALGPDEAEPPSDERRRGYEELVAAGMSSDILFTSERLRFLRKANLNNRLSSAALDATGFRFTHTDLSSSVGATVDWYRAHRWLI